MLLMISWSGGEDRHIKNIYNIYYDAWTKLYKSLMGATNVAPGMLARPGDGGDI